MHDPSALLLFIRIVEEGSIAAAARTMGMTRSTAARHLASLEDSLGTQLVIRSTSGLSLTQAGEVYLQYAYGIQNSLAEAENALSNLDGRPQGHLRISAPIVVTQHLLAPMLQDFFVAYPDITIELLLGNDVRQVVSGSVDVALQIGLEQNSDLLCRSLFSTDDVLMAHASYLEGKEAITSVEQLIEYDCLLWKASDGSLGHWLTRDGQVIDIPRPKLVSNSLDLLNAMLCHGAGIISGPLLLYRNEVSRGEIVTILPDQVGMKRDFFLVYSSTRHVPPKVRVLLEFATQWMAAFIQEGDNFTTRFACEKC